MKITVITVAFNASLTIADTLESVAAQSHPNIEHIVVDGASTDGTFDIIKRHGHRVSRMFSEPDSGIYEAMNKGLRLATGDIIGFLNADDVYANTGVLARVAATMGDGRLDALFGDAEFVRSDNPGKPTRRYRSHRFRPSRIAWGWMPAHPATYLHRRVFEHFGAFRPDYRIAGDFELIARIFHANILKYQYQPELMVRMRTGGISTGGLRNTLLLNREVLRACRENGIYTNPLMIISKYPFKFLEFLSPGR